MWLSNNPLDLQASIAINLNVMNAFKARAILALVVLCEEEAIYEDGAFYFSLPHAGFRGGRLGLA
jgi:hypothetical protein